MDVLHYRCKLCGCTKHNKARIGSQEFGGGSFTNQALQGIIFGRIVDDPARPPDTFMRYVKEGSDDHNACTFGIFDGKVARGSPVHVWERTEHGKDLEMRMSLSEKGDDIKDAAIQQLKRLAAFLSPCFTEQPGISPGDPPRMLNAGGLTEREVEVFTCYIATGHDYELIGRQIDGTGPIVPKED